MRAGGAALASGTAHVATYAWPDGTWTVRVCHAPILKNSDNSISDYSSGAWKRELGLTMVAGQHLPGATFGGSSVELHHRASGVRISFCALEALRAWQLLDLPPVPHLSPHAEPPTWDYTFTTPYAGSIAVAPLASGMPDGPDGCSPHSRPATNLATGKATLRKPLCKCRGSSGREALISVQKASPTAATVARCEDGGVVPDGSEESSPPAASVAARTTAPAWVDTTEVVDLESLLRDVRAPDFVDCVECAAQHHMPLAGTRTQPYANTPPALRV